MKRNHRNKIILARIFVSLVQNISYRPVDEHANFLRTICASRRRWSCFQRRGVELRQPLRLLNAFFCEPTQLFQKPKNQIFSVRGRDVTYVDPPQEIEILVDQYEKADDQVVQAKPLLLLILLKNIECRLIITGNFFLMDWLCQNKFRRAVKHDDVRRFCRLRRRNKRNFFFSKWTPAFYR